MVRWTDSGNHTVGCPCLNYWMMEFVNQVPELFRSEVDQEVNEITGHGVQSPVDQVESTVVEMLKGFQAPFSLHGISRNLRATGTSLHNPVCIKNHVSITECLQSLERGPDKRLNRIR